MARFKFSFRSIQLVVTVLPALLLSGCGGGNKAADNNTTPTTMPTRSTAMTSGGNMSTNHMTNGMTTSHMTGGNMGNSHTIIPRMTSGGMGSTRMTTGGMGAVPAGYKRDKNGRLHDRSGRFVKESSITPDPFGRRRDRNGRFISGQKGPGFMNSQ